MHLDAFDRRIIDALSGSSGHVTLAELVKDSGFARSTVIIHLERLGAEGLLLKEKKLSNDRGWPSFLYRLAGTHTLKTAGSAQRRCSGVLDA